MKQQAKQQIYNDYSIEIYVRFCASNPPLIFSFSLFIAHALNPRFDRGKIAQELDIFLFDELHFAAQSERITNTFPTQLAINELRSG